MPTYKQNAKLMAKNSAYMYVQMGIKMLVSLYTVRVILQALGAEDYGIYNVVGGFVTMFSFVTNTLVSASQRFFAFSIGRGEEDKLNRYFNASLLCFLLLGVLLFIIIECVGIWFVNNKMVIPNSRLNAANWVLQFAIAAFLVRILAVPFKAMIVSHERMVWLAIISVLDTFLLLGIAILLQWISTDKLKVYSMCMFGVSLFSTFLYVALCKWNFPMPSKIMIRWEGTLMKEMLGYCGWYMFGTMALMVRSQGINILLNVFFNPVVNAARAIAYQINNAINQFVNAFYNAVRPQITKLTASDQRKKMLSLIYSSSIISFLLMSMVAIPLLVEMPFILSFWIGEVPQYTVIFSRLVVLTAVVDTFGHPLTTAVCASGKIRNFQVLTGVMLMLNLPVSYVFLKINPHPYIVFYISILFSAFTQIVRIIFMKRMYRMPIGVYIKTVILRCLFIFVGVLTLTWGVQHILGISIMGHIITIVLSAIFTAMATWIWGIDKKTRGTILSSVNKYLHASK